jgi:DNA-binding response OmpR family regulator
MTTPEPNQEAEEAIRVLVVSSDDAAAGFLVAFLERHGFIASSVAIGEAAGAISSASPALDLIVVDIEIEVVRSIRLLADPDRARTPVVVLGAIDSDDDMTDDATAAGATAWINRPVDDTELLAGLRAAAGT